MNLIALPHTNEFIKMFPIGKPLDVSAEVDELIESAPPVTRPVILLLLSGKTQEQVAAEAGIPRTEIYRLLSEVRPKVKKRKVVQNEAVLKHIDKTDTDRRITALIVSCLEQSMTCEEIAVELQKAGFRTQRGPKFSKRTAAKWIQARGLKRIPKSLWLYEKALACHGSGMGPKRIADHFNETGIESPRGKPWTKGSVESMLKIAMGTKRRMAAKEEK